MFTAKFCNTFTTQAQKKNQGMKQKSILTEVATKKDASTVKVDTKNEELKQESAEPPTKEIGGPKGPEPTRYGDWEKGGLISDF